MQNFIVAVCLLLTLGHAASVVKPDLQQEHCSWGAQYWCSSPETASLCGKTEWCAHNDWPYDVVQDSSCTAAQTVIKNTRSLIQKSAQKPVSEYDYAMFLARSCTFFMDEKERHQCKELVTSKDVLPKLVQLVDSKLSVKSVATAVGVCQKKKNIPADKPCLKCPETVSSVQKLLSKFLTQDAFMKLIEPQCVKLGQGRHLCRTIGRAKFADFYNALINAPATSVCEGVTQCLAVSSGLQSVQASTECDTCKAVVSEIRELDRSPGVQTVLQNLIKSVCAKLGAFAQMCDILADEELEHLSELIATEMEPDVVCEELKLCGQPEQSILQFNPKSEAPKQPSNTTCFLCKYVVAYLDTLLEKNATEADIEALLEKVCNLLPQNYSQECQDLVREYGPLIVQLLLAELEPEKVCEVLSLCAPQKMGILQFKPRSEAPKQSSNTTCFLCKYVVLYLETYLEKNATEDQITTLLKEVCNILPQTYSQECNQLVSQYGPLIVQMLLAELKPEKVCEELKLCPPQKLAFSQVKTQPKQPNDEMCDVCKYVVTYLDTFLDKNTTQDEIEALLDKVCQILPTSLSQQCVSIVKTYGPLIIELLIQELQPAEVCKTLSLCPPNKHGTLPHVAAPVLKMASPEVGKQKTEMCALCESVTLVLENVLKEKATQAEVVSALDKICDLLPEKDKGPCVQLLPLYTGYVIDLINQELPAKLVCKLIKVCVDDEMKETKSPEPRGSVKSGELCPLCLLVFEEVYSIIEKNTTKTAIEAALEKVCDVLPSTIKSECDSFVDLYLPYVVDLIVQEMPPNQICQELGLCNASMGQALTLTQSLHTNKVTSAKAGELCTLCIYVFEALDKLLVENSSEVEIEAAFNHVCDKMSTYKDQCEHFVALYTPFAIDFIAKKLTPAQICNEFRLCINATSVKLHAQTDIEKLTAGPKCALCEYVIKYLDKILAENATEQEIIKALDQVCYLVPSTLKSECVSFVGTYSSLILTLLQNISPEQICSSLGLCSSQVKVKLHAPINIMKPTTGPQCGLCEYIIETLETLLNENATEQEIIDALDRVCNLLPKTLKSECDSFVANYTSIILKLLQTVSPDQICSYLGLCSSQVKAAPKSLLLASESTTTTTPAQYVEYCSACKFVMYDIQTALRYPFWQKQSKFILSSMCGYLKTGQALCEQLVENNYAYILNILGGFNFPMEFCQKIDFCEPPAHLDLPADDKKPTGELQCELCDYVVKYLDTVLTQNATVEQIEAALDQLCSMAPSSLKSECVGFVAEYTPEMLKYLKTLSPDQVCNAMGLCPSRVKAAPKSLLFASESTTTTTPAPYVEYCSACKFALYDIQTTLRYPFWQKQSKVILNSTCGYLKTGQALCEQLVENNYAYILNILDGFNFPMEFCQKIDFCEPPAQIETETRCSSCKSVVKMLKLQSHQVTSTEEMNALADSTCKMASSNEAFQCKTLLKQHMPQLVQLMAKYEDPASVCEAASLCKSRPIEMLYKVLRP